jgi:hypothetical protein
MASLNTTERYATSDILDEVYREVGEKIKI